MNQAGALVPIAGAGLVASFIASALTMYDKSKQAARMQKLLTLATTPADALDETAHYAAIGLATRYRMQIGMLDDDSATGRHPPSSTSSTALVSAALVAL